MGYSIKELLAKSFFSFFMACMKEFDLHELLLYTGEFDEEKLKKEEKKIKEYNGIIKDAITAFLLKNGKL